LVGVKTQYLRLVLKHRRNLATIWFWCSIKLFQ